VVLASALMGGVPRLHLPVRRLAPAVLFVATGITVLNTLGQEVIDRARENPAFTVVTGAVGLLLYLYLFNHVLLFGAALMATSPHGKVRDLAQRAPEPAAEPAGQAG
jgi:membrane protein